MSKLRIFISWSGTRSRAVAEALRDWFEDVLPMVDPFLSSSDIDKGAKWGEAVSRQLEESSFAVICLTPENLNAPWISFEAGAISAKPQSRVCTYLLELDPKAIEGPLAQFQHTRANREDTELMLKSLNLALGDAGVSKERLARAFEKWWWPELEQRLSKIPHPSPEQKQQSPAQLSAEGILGELATLRARMEAQSAEFRRFIELITCQQNHSDQRPDHNGALLRAYEGVWQDEVSGSEFYLRVVKGALVAPYCWYGDSTLTGRFHSFTQIDKILFGRFQWFGDMDVHGYGYFGLVSKETIEGGWSMGEPPVPLSGNLVANLANQKTLQQLTDGVQPLKLRRTSDPYPKIAQQYFRKLEVN